MFQRLYKISTIIAHIHKCQIWGKYLRNYVTELYLTQMVWLCLEKRMATHCSILAWKIPRTEEPSGL